MTAPIFYDSVIHTGKVCCSFARETFDLAHSEIIHYKYIHWHAPALLQVILERRGVDVHIEIERY